MKKKITCKRKTYDEEISFGKEKLKRNPIMTVEHLLKERRKGAQGLIDMTTSLWDPVQDVIVYRSIVSVCPLQELFLSLWGVPEWKTDIIITAGNRRTQSIAAVIMEETILLTITAIKRKRKQTSGGDQESSISYVHMTDACRQA